MEVEGEGEEPWRAIMASAGRMAAGVREQAVKLLNEAKMQPDAPSKADLLKNVMEIVLHREPSLLPEFVPYLMELQSEPGSPVRKYLAEYVNMHLFLSLLLCVFLSLVVTSSGMTFALSFLKAASNLFRRIAFHCRYVRSFGLLLHVQSRAFFVFASRLFRYRTPIGLDFFFRVSDYSEFLYI